MATFTEDRLVEFQSADEFEQIDIQLLYIQRAEDGEIENSGDDSHTTDDSGVSSP